MSTLIVQVHPDAESLTHAAAARLGERLVGDVVVADLMEEEFDPRFAAGDRRDYVGQVQTDPEVAAEQARIDAADHLVLVFPVYWWSMPALLKGWIDRVFVAPWAFTYDVDGHVVRGLQRLTVHLLPISGTEAESFERHGYLESFTTQIQHGIVDFCGARRGVTAFVWDAESADRDVTAGQVEAATGRIATAISPGASAGRPPGAR